MSEAEQQESKVGETKADWNEEYDAWLELIEDHLKNIRRMLVIVLIAMILVAISVLTLASMLIYSFLHPMYSM